MFHAPDKYRVRTGPFATNDRDLYGAFFVPFGTDKVPLKVLATDGTEFGWGHVSVSLPTRCPTWDEMCCVKNLFWDAEDCVVQFHPPKSEYVNNHPYVLHLWRPINEQIPRPPRIMV